MGRILNRSPQPIYNPADHPGMVWDPKVGKPVTKEQWAKNHATGNGWLQLLTAGAPFLAGGVGALAGGAGAGAAGTGSVAATGGGAAIPSIGATGGIAAGSFPTIAGTAGATSSGGGMGILSTAGNILKGKGTLGKILNISKDVAPILAGASKSRGEAQQIEEQNQLRRDALNQSGAADRENALQNRAGIDMDRRKFALSAPGSRLDTGVQGSMVSRAHNVTVGNGAPITLSSGRSITPIHYGGLGADDLLSPEARQLGDQVTHDMLLQQMKGDNFDPLPAVNIPGATPDRGSSALDSILGGAAFGTSMAGAINPTVSKILDRARTGTVTDNPIGAPPMLAGVTPFKRPPRGYLLDDPSTDWSNR